MNRDTGDAGLYVELPLAEADRARLRELGPGPVWFAEPGTASEADARAFSDAGTALGNPRAAWVANAPRLRWLQLASVGIDGYLGLDWPALGRDLAVTNLGDLFADPVAQSCLAASSRSIAASIGSPGCAPRPAGRSPPCGPGCDS